MKASGPVFARDGDQVTIKTSLTGGMAPFSLSWTLDGQPVQWSQRVTPYLRPGCVGISLSTVGLEDEGTYTCRLTNPHGETSFTTTLVVDCKLRISGCCKNYQHSQFCRIEFSNHFIQPKTLTHLPGMSAYFIFHCDARNLSTKFSQHLENPERLRYFTVSFRSRAEGE